MSAFQLTYYSALDNAIRRQGFTLDPQCRQLIAPTGWCAEQVEQAFMRDHPGFLLLTCKPAP